VVSCASRDEALDVLASELEAQQSFRWMAQQAEATQEVAHA
jgi:hypothetical protein